MKKVQTKKLTLGKTTVAKLQMSEEQMRHVNGGNDTKPPKPIIGGITNSLVDEPPCVLPPNTSPTGA